MGKFREDEAFVHGEEIAKAISENVFRQNRPKAEMRNKMNDFVIVSIDGRLDDSIIGNDSTGIVDTSMVFSLFARDKSYGMDIAKLSSMLESLEGMLPYSKDGIMIYDAKLLITGQDDLGFSTYFVETKLRIN